MGLLDWLRDGFLGDGVEKRRETGNRGPRPAKEELDDPSGPHHFGRRAHRPDPKGRYGFGSGTNRRAGGL
jgi:hypothetical protein